MAKAGTAPGATDPGELEKLNEALDVKLAHEASKSLHLFIEYVLRDDNGNPIILEEIHKEGLAFVQWCQDEGRYPIIQAPWGSGKTTIYVVGVGLYNIGKDPNVRIGIYSNQENLASDRVTALKGYVEDSKEFARVFPAIKPNLDIWGAHKFQVKRTSRDTTPTCQSKGILSAKTGPRFDIIFPDDITDFENSVSSAVKREEVDLRVHNAVVSRLSSKGNILGVATAWHSQDAIEKLKQDDRFAVLVQAVNETCDGIIQENLITGEIKQLALPAMMDRDKLLQEKANRPREFARGRMQQPYTEEEKTFKLDAIQAAIDVGPEHVKALEGLPRGMGVDLSNVGRAGKAVVEGADETDALRLSVDMCTLLDCTSPELCTFIGERIRLTAAEWCIVENNAYQDSFNEWADATGSEHLPLEPFTTGRNKADLDLGLPGLAAALNAGGIRLVFTERPEACVKGICECKDGMCKLVKDLRDHPFGDNDSIMALWFLWRKFRVEGSASTAESTGEPLRQRRGVLYSAREGLRRVRGERRRLI